MTDAASLPLDIPESFWDSTQPEAEEFAPLRPGRPVGALGYSPEVPPLQGTTAFLPSSAAKNPVGPQKLQYWYDGIIDLMISRPGINYKEIARELNRAPSTIGIIVRSDMFKLRYEERRKALANEIDERIHAKLTAVAEKGLDLTLQIMEQKQDKLAIGVVKELTLGALDRLGYSPAAQSGPSVVVNNNTSAQGVAVSASDLAEARESMRLAGERRAGDHQPLLLEGAAGAGDEEESGGAL